MADIPPRVDAPEGDEHSSSSAQLDSTRGVRAIVIGAIVALLAPLAGFLGGTMVGPSSNVADFDPLFLWLFAGMVIGGIGGVVAILGALRWNRANIGSR